jgi:hypothetical protein
MQRPKFKCSTKQAPKSSVSFSKSILHRRSYIPSYSFGPILPCRWLFSAKKTSRLHVPHSDFRMQSDHKAFSFLSIFYLGSVLKPNLLRLRKLNLFLDLHQNFALCHLIMAIVVALFIGARHTNV